MVEQQDIQQINNISYNQEQTHLALSTNLGFYIYSTDPFVQIHKINMQRGVKLIHILQNTNKVLLTYSQHDIIQEPNTVILFNYNELKQEKEYTFIEPIYGVQSIRNMFIVIQALHIQCMSLDSKLIYTIDTLYNIQGIVDVSFDQSFCIAAPHVNVGSVVISWFTSSQPYKDSSQQQYSSDGQHQDQHESAPNHSFTTKQLTSKHTVNKQTTYTDKNSNIYKGLNIVDSVDTQVSVNSTIQWVKYKSKIIIDSNKSGISQIAVTYEGDQVAITSITGTLIRIFDTRTSVQLKQYRRGIQPTQIYSLYFDIQSNFLICGSEKQTIHIYKLKSTNTTTYLKALSNFLPLVDDEWSFSQFYLPTYNQTYQIKTILKNQILYIFGSNDTRYMIQLTQSGGQLQQVQKNSLLTLN